MLNFERKNFTVYAHKIASFSKLCDVNQDGHGFLNTLALRDILVPVSWQTKSKKTPFLARPEPISNTLYNTLQ